MGDMKRTSLYYPEIAIPPERWLKQAVLYFDQVASIVPQNINRWTERQIEQSANIGIASPKRLIVVSEDLRYLEAEEEYRPIYPESLVQTAGSAQEAFNRDFLESLLSQRFQETLGDRRGWLFSEMMHVFKGPPALFKLLVDDGYARPHLFDSEWYIFERSTAHLYMSILAKHLARQDADDTVPSTSQEYGSYRDITFRVGEAVSGVCVADLVFVHAIPAPAIDASIKEILSFKRRHRDELLLFRQEVSLLEENLAKAEDIEHVKHALSEFAERKTSALSELRRSFSDATFDITLESLQSLVQMRSPTLWLSAAALGGKLEKISEVPVTSLASGAVVSAVVQVGVKVASGLKKKRNLDRSSAFSYLYHCERELGGEP
jgi:hypothetical protein